MWNWCCGGHTSCASCLTFPIVAHSRRSGKTQFFVTRLFVDHQGRGHGSRDLWNFLCACSRCTDSDEGMMQASGDGSRSAKCDQGIVGHCRGSSEHGIKPVHFCHHVGFLLLCGVSAVELMGAQREHPPLGCPPSGQKSSPWRGVGMGSSETPDVLTSVCICCASNGLGTCTICLHCAFGAEPLKVKKPI